MLIQPKESIYLPIPKKKKMKTFNQSKEKLFNKR
jgi:hypothetical protein